MESTQTKSTKTMQELSRDFLDNIPNLEVRRGINANIIANNRSFVGRLSRITDAQRLAYNKGMGEYGLHYSTETSLQAQLANVAYGSLVLDIGFGTGETLANMAEESVQYALPELFVGIETFKPGIGALLVKAYAKKLKNIRMFHGDAIPILWNMVEENSIDRIQIFFPDPWQKLRHNKRRMVQRRFLQLCLHILKPNGILWIITDWQDYAAWIDSSLNGCKLAGELTSSSVGNLTANSIGNAVHNTATTVQEATQITTWHLIEDAESRAYLETLRTSPTRFERKGLEKGHSIYSWVLKKIAEDPA